MTTSAVRSEWTATLTPSDPAYRPTGAGPRLGAAALQPPTASRPPFTVGLDIDFERRPEARPRPSPCRPKPRTARRPGCSSSWPADDPKGHAEALEFSRRVLEEDLAILGVDRRSPTCRWIPRAEFHTRGDRAGVDTAPDSLNDYLQAAAAPATPAPSTPASAVAGTSYAYAIVGGLALDNVITAEGARLIGRSGGNTLWASLGAAHVRLLRRHRRPGRRRLSASRPSTCWQHRGIDDRWSATDRRSAPPSDRLPASG